MDDFGISMDGSMIINIGSLNCGDLGDLNNVNASAVVAEFQQKQWFH